MKIWEKMLDWSFRIDCTASRTEYGTYIYCRCLAYARTWICDGSQDGRLITHKVGRTTRRKRLPCDRWMPLRSTFNTPSIFYVGVSLFLCMMYICSFCRVLVQRGSTVPLIPHRANSYQTLDQYPSVFRDCNTRLNDQLPYDLQTQSLIMTFPAYLIFQKKKSN